MTDPIKYTIRLRGMKKHPKQMIFVRSDRKRKIVRAGRRGGKTTGCATLAIEQFCKGRRVLYAVPTTEQLNAFWREVTTALAEPIQAGVFKKNETEHRIELPGTLQAIRAKSAWNADTLRGDFADLLILDEVQLMAEDAWGVVGAPMLVDNNGDAVFIYTPPSFHSLGVTKARDPRWIAKLYKQHENDPRWLCLHFTSHDNPYISAEALTEITDDMTALAYRQEIEAEDIDEVPGALWNRDLIERGAFNNDGKHIGGGRVTKAPEHLVRAYVGVDPPGGATECGIVASGAGLCNCRGPQELHLFVLDDSSDKMSPDQWGKAAVTSLNRTKADRIVGETNFGGDMVKSTIKTVDEGVAYSDVHATRGKAVRAEPIAALYEQGRAHHVGNFPKLEDEMCSWVPGVSSWSPNRMDGLVWSATKCKIVGSTLGVIELQKQQQAEAAKPYAQRFAEVKASQMERVRTNGNTEACPSCHATCIVQRGPLKHCSQCGNEWGLAPSPAAHGGRAALAK